MYSLIREDIHRSKVIGSVSLEDKQISFTGFIYIYDDDSIKVSTFFAFLETIAIEVEIISSLRLVFYNYFRNHYYGSRNIKYSLLTKCRKFMKQSA